MIYFFIDYFIPFNNFICLPYQDITQCLYTTYFIISTMQITEKATKLCPMCNEINHIEVGEVGFVCNRCGYKAGAAAKLEPKTSKFDDSKPPKGLGREI